MGPMRFPAVLVAAVGIALFLAACSSAAQTDSASEFDDASSTAAPSLLETNTTTITATAPPSSVTPLPEQSPTMAMFFDGRALGEMAMRYDTWDEPSSSPIDYIPTAAVVMAVNESIVLATQHEARLTISSRIQRTGLRFESIGSATTTGTQVAFEASEIGLWYVEIRASFAPSDAYVGSGVIEYSAWVSVVDLSAPCVSLGAAPATVTGLTDSDGCPQSGSAELNLDALLREFHCFPWPAGINIDVGSGLDWFYREPFDTPDSGVEVVDLPADATPTGLFLSTGQILKSVSDSDAIFVSIGDDRAERWPRDLLGVGCV